MPDMTKNYRIDLNCDLGEGEPLAHTRALMNQITSANVACGGHAGGLRSMLACVELAKRHDVRLGAHPGQPGNFGRGAIRINGDDLEMVLVQQVSTLATIAWWGGVLLHHVKLHGALYHAVENSSELARRYLDVVSRYWPRLRVYAVSGGLVARFASAAGIEVWQEAFADRAYENSGKLAPRASAGAVLTKLNAVLDQTKSIVQNGEVTSSRGKRLRVSAQTICLHSDTPGAVRLAKGVAEILTVQANCDGNRTAAR